MGYSLPDVEDRSILMCKTFGHPWDEFVPHDADPPPKDRFGVYLRCMRCTTERCDWVNWSGWVDHRRYEYPANYRHAPKAPKVELRVMFLSGRKEFKRLVARRPKGEIQVVKGAA